MRYGFTTGSCAAAAAKAATYMLLTGKEKSEICIKTPKGIDYEAKIVDTSRSEKSVRCSVIKDGGDDPDVTTGAHIIAEVAITSPDEYVADINGKNVKIVIDGGIGVGRVTKPGLDQPVGEAAINHVPREMIEKEVREVCEVCDYKGTLYVTISVPEGEKIAKQTFNPRLGIVGGISILGTSGIVEPMSTQALLDTIEVELRQKKELGCTMLTVSPGNYGADYMQKTYNYNLDKSVKCSNFIGATIDMAARLGFERMLLTGHIGKLIKVAGGIMNTHSKEGDCRMELMASAVLMAGADNELLHKIMECVTTEDAIAQIKQTPQGDKLLEQAMEYLIKKIHYHLNKRAAGKMQIECIIYSNDYGELAKSDNAVRFLQEAGECN